MTSTQCHLPGSQRKPLKNATLTGAAVRDERVRVTILLQPTATAQHWDDVHAYARGHGLRRHSDSCPDKNLQVFTATVSQAEAAFGTRLYSAEHPEHGRCRVRTGHLYVPRHLAPHITAILGLDTRPCAEPRLHRRATTSGFAGPQIAQIYNLPSYDGTGQTIGIIELGGQFRQTDYLKSRKTAGLSAGPTPIMVGVAGGKNGPSTGADGADGEVMLDAEVAAGIASGAQLRLYFAPNSDAGFVEAVLAAVHDRCNALSISWGQAESTWTGQALAAMNQALQAAAAAGITVCVASGDNGSTDGANGINVDFPASSPYALACGGTTLVVNGSRITSETVWNSNGGATGGGYSTQFARPAYQANIGNPRSRRPGRPKPTPAPSTAGRMVPDVAGPADPDTGWTVYVDGQVGVIGGTSAVAPMWAGIVARLNQALGKNIGDPHATFYANPQAFRDITSGSNGAWTAVVGPDPCTGLGSPNGAALLAALKGAGASVHKRAA